MLNPHEHLTEVFERDEQAREEFAAYVDAQHRIWDAEDSAADDFAAAIEARIAGELTQADIHRFFPV